MCANFTIFWRLTKAINPVPFIGECHQFKLFQNDVKMPRIWYKMVDVWLWLRWPIFYQICSSIQVLSDRNKWLIIHTCFNKVNPFGFTRDVKRRSNFWTLNYMFEFEFGIVTFDIRIQLTLSRPGKWSVLVIKSLSVIKMMRFVCSLPFYCA